MSYRQNDIIVSTSKHKITMGRQISAINIKRLWYGDCISQEPTLTAAGITTMLADFTEIMNVHQDTWAIEESEPSQDAYRNQLTGMVYRRGTKTMGEVSFTFTIGRYDFDLKAALMGGTAAEDGKSWSRGKGAVSVNRTMVALTEDDVYCILSYADLSTREANTDGAIGLAVVATAMEPEDNSLSSEYWVDGKA